MVDKIKNGAKEAHKETSKFLLNTWELAISLSVPTVSIYAVLIARNVISEQTSVNSLVVLYGLLALAGSFGVVHGLLQLKKFLSK